MACWRCEKCGARNCGSDECTTCFGQGVKKKIKLKQLEKSISELGRNDKP